MPYAADARSKSGKLKVRIIQKCFGINLSGYETCLRMLIMEVGIHVC